jgi:hypothetical protein
MVCPAAVLVKRIVEVASKVQFVRAGKLFCSTPAISSVAPASNCNCASVEFASERVTPDCTVAVPPATLKSPAVTVTLAA